ncbi:MAG: hypothetical protein WCA83_14135 [Azonexus sp.]
MAGNTERRLAAVLVAALAFPAQAASVACHVTYGGETRVISAGATSNPYTIAPVPLGSYFLFSIVFRQEPTDLAGIKLTTYADRAEGPVVIHQAAYPYPPPAASVKGFTGLNFVYEPVRDGELQYWCELKDTP